MDLETFLGMAQHAIDTGNIQAAFEMYEAALQRAPNNVDVLEAYGEMMLHHGDPEAAKRLLLHAVTVCPNEGHVKYLNLAQLSTGHAALGYYESAVSVLLGDLSKARKLKTKKHINRTISTAKCAMAELYLTDLCEEPEAEERCERYVIDAEMYCKDNIEVHQLKGSLRLSQNRPEDAIQALRTAVKLTHTLGEQYQPPYESKLELGKLLMQVDPKDAFDFFLEILQLDDSDPYVWFLLGESARLRGCKNNDAARILRHARLRVVAAQVGDEALAEIDQSIRLLIEAIGGADAVALIPNMEAPNPLDYLEPDAEDEEAEEAPEDIADEELLEDAEAGWEDIDDDD
jgi:predicted Zn-dependent protease